MRIPRKEKKKRKREILKKFPEAYGFIFGYKETSFFIGMINFGRKDNG